MCIHPVASSLACHCMSYILSQNVVQPTDGDILHHQAVVHSVWLTQCGKVSMHSTHWLALCMLLHHVLPHYIAHSRSHCAASYGHHLTAHWRVMLSILFIVQQLRYLIFEVTCKIHILNYVLNRHSKYSFKDIIILSTPVVCSDGYGRDYSSYIQRVCPLYGCRHRIPQAHTYAVQLLL